MIVKDESHVIIETLTCMVKYIDYYIIHDTGSTDNTIEVIRKFFEKHGIKGEVHSDKWVNFGHNRSLALKSCLGKSEYIWVMDADDIIEGEIVFPKVMDADGYYLKFKSGCSYRRQQIFKNSYELNWRYDGVLHEYPKSDIERPKIVDIKGDYAIISRRLGARNKNKHKYFNDAIVLEKFLREKPDQTRETYYLANSYADYAEEIGRNDMAEKAVIVYRKRIDLGGWLEEIYQSKYRIAGIYEKFSDQKYKNYAWKLAEEMYIDAYHTSQRPPITLNKEQGERFLDFIEKNKLSPIEKESLYLLIDNQPLFEQHRKAILQFSKDRRINKAYSSLLVDIITAIQPMLEPIYVIIKHYYTEQKFKEAYKYVKIAETIKKPEHVNLYLNEDVYDFLFFELASLISIEMKKYSEAYVFAKKAMASKNEDVVKRMKENSVKIKSNLKEEAKSLNCLVYIGYDNDQYYLKKLIKFLNFKYNVYLCTPHKDYSNSELVISINREEFEVIRNQINFDKIIFCDILPVFQIKDTILFLTEEFRTFYKDGLKVEITNSFVLNKYLSFVSGIFCSNQNIVDIIHDTFGISEDKLYDFEYQKIKLFDKLNFKYRIESNNFDITHNGFKFYIPIIPYNIKQFYESYFAETKNPVILQHYFMHCIKTDQIKEAEITLQKMLKFKNGEYEAYQFMLNTFKIMLNNKKKNWKENLNLIDQNNETEIFNQLYENAKAEFYDLELRPLQEPKIKLSNDGKIAVYFKYQNQTNFDQCFKSFFNCCEDSNLISDVYIYDPTEQYKDNKYKVINRMTLEYNYIVYIEDCYQFIDKRKYLNTLHFEENENLLQYAFTKSESIWTFAPSIISVSNLKKLGDIWNFKEFDVSIIASTLNLVGKYSSFKPYKQIEKYVEKQNDITLHVMIKNKDIDHRKINNISQLPVNKTFNSDNIKLDLAMIMKNTINNQFNYKKSTIKYLMCLYDAISEFNKTDVKYLMFVTSDHLFNKVNIEVLKEEIMKQDYDIITLDSMSNQPDFISEVELNHVESFIISSRITKLLQSKIEERMMQKNFIDLIKEVVPNIKTYSCNKMIISRILSNQFVDTRHKDLEGYKFYSMLDSVGSDIGWFDLPPEKLKEKADADPKCVGFNTLGWLKFDIKHDSKLVDLYTATQESEGLYIKESYL